MTTRSVEFTVQGDVLDGLEQRANMKLRELIGNSVESRSGWIDELEITPLVETWQNGPITWQARVRAHITESGGPR